MYRRTKQRPPREIEQTAAMEERDELREAVNRLLAENQQMSQRLRQSELVIDKLLHDKVAIALDLQKVKAALDFLTRGRN